MNTIANEYLPTSNGHANGNGNGHSNGHGHAELSPSQKAWQTAKDRAVAEAQSRQAENSARFYAENDEVIRALTDANLPHGAARLFVLLCKAGWKKEFGGMYKDRIGSIMIDGRRLARLCGGASVNCLYVKNRKQKIDARTKKVLRSASRTGGWIEKLIAGGYLWVSKHRIPNIQPSRWPNVFNLCCHVPQRYTPNLPWEDGGFGSENVTIDHPPEACSPAENKNLGASEAPGDGETPVNTLVQHRKANRPSTGRPTGPAPDGQPAQHRKANWPSTGRPTGPTVNPVHLRESGDPSTDSKIIEGGGKAPPNASQAQKTSKEETELVAWRQSLNGSYPSRLEAIRKKLSGQRELATAPNVKKFLGRKIAILNELLDGPLPPGEAPAPRAATPERNRPLSPEEILEGARYLVETGKAHLLTKVQKEALGRV